MGDFVKGRPDPALAPGLRRGIFLHRQVDSYAQNDPTFRRSKRRLDDLYGHCKGVMIDIFYDHFLARSWETFSDTRLEVFAADIYRLLERDYARLPAGLQRVAPSMIRHNWLVSYRDIATIERVLTRLAARLRRPNPLAGGVTELRRHYQALEEDFRAFLPAAAGHLRTLSRRE